MGCSRSYYFLVADAVAVADALPFVLAWLPDVAAFLLLLLPAAVAPGFATPAADVAAFVGLVAPGFMAFTVDFVGLVSLGFVLPPFADFADMLLLAAPFTADGLSAGLLLDISPDVAILPLPAEVAVGFGFEAVLDDVWLTDG